MVSEGKFSCIAHFVLTGALHKTENALRQEIKEEQSTGVQ